MPETHLDAAETTAIFEQTERTLRLARTKLGLALGSILMPAGFLLDWTFYASQFAALISVRLAATVFLLIAWACMPREHCRPWIYAFSVFALAVPGLAIASMIGLTDGAASNYFFGLILLMVVGQLVGFSGSESTIYSGITILGFVAAVISRSLASPLEWERLVLSLFFLTTTAVVCVLLCQANLNLRLQDFLAQGKLDASNRQLDEKNRQLEELDRLRGAFLAGVSHELKTPLTLILAPLDNLLSSRNAIPEQVGQELAIVRRNADRLRVLVDDLLDIVRLDNAVLKLDLDDVDALELAMQIAAAIRPLVELRGLRFKTQFATQPLHLRIDLQRLERVLFNLLTNAIKFSPPQSEVEFTFAVEGTDSVRFEVVDHGPGIPLEEQTKVFERFYQASNNRLHSSQGLGLGLALSRDIVRQLGGEIWLTSQLDQGSKFTVSLPAKSGVSPDKTNPLPPAREIIPVRPAPASIGPQTGPIDVLVVDDEHDLREFLVQTISADAKVLGVASGLSGVEAAGRELPTVIVLDLMLPDISGLEVLRRLRQDERLCDTRIVMVTAQSDESIKVQALTLGADDFLGKPFGISELRARIASLLRSGRLQRDLRRQRTALAQSLEQLKLAESKLFQSEKMRAIGTLAAGLLHEINNPVHFTLMAVEVLKRDWAKGRDIGEVADDIRDGIKRIGDIVSDLRSFAHPESTQLSETFAIGEAITQALRFAAYDLRNLHVLWDPVVAGKLGVQAERSQVVQVFVNFLLNSAKAIQRCTDGRTGKISISIQPLGSRIQLAVCDNGIGIPPENLPRIAEPFFTTSEPGQGLGLGLSICDTIVRNHGGKLTVDSEWNCGTTIAFDLPSILHEGNVHEPVIQETNTLCG